MIIHSRAIATGSTPDKCQFCGTAGLALPTPSVHEHCSDNAILNGEQLDVHQYETDKFNTLLRGDPRPKSFACALQEFALKYHGLFIIWTGLCIQSPIGAVLKGKSGQCHTYIQHATTHTMHTCIAS